MESKEWIVEGNVWKVGDNVNAESFMSGTWGHGPYELFMEHIGEMLIPDFPKKVRKGDALVGGSNFGCSSGRNFAAPLKDNGIGVVLCRTSARSFYRNAVNSGLPIFNIGKDIEKINMGDRVRVNVRTGEIKNLTTGEEIKAKEFPDFIMDILEAGGIIPRILSRRSEYEHLK